MARSIKEKRAQFMNTLINKIFNNLDPSGKNSRRYKKMLDSMTDEQFDKWVRNTFKKDTYNLYWEAVEFENETDVENIKKAADAINVPLYEKLVVPYLDDDPSVNPVTPVEVPVGYLHIKRMPQTIHHKNAGSVYIDKRNSKTNQVTGEDKNGRNTDVETYDLIAFGAKNSIKEFLNPRADDVKRKSQMYEKIDRDGVVYLKDLHSNPEDRTSINTLNVYYIAAGLVTNLVNPNRMFSSPRDKDTR